MRTTRATAAVERLKRRSGKTNYQMILNAGSMLYLVEDNGDSPATVLCEPMSLDEFVRFVDTFGPQIPRRATKNDLTFEAQLVKKKP